MEVVLLDKECRFGHATERAGLAQIRTRITHPSSFTRDPEYLRAHAYTSHVLVRAWENTWVVSLGQIGP